tara:strand:+ start:1010 stop:1222 length:213 start_codon:yes stop_codon:yes gene_type:complete
MNERLKRLIGFAMYEKGLSKIDISDLMDWSYPTALKKINKPGTLKISEADRLCKILNLEISQFLNNNNNE